MQRSWRIDSDKLTFIACESKERKPDQPSLEHEIATMVGDVNLFILANEEETGDVSLVGEFELMIGRKENQHRGLGRAMIVTFLFYVLTHQEKILEEYFSTPRNTSPKQSFTYLRVKVGGTNHRSIKLFESLGFEKTEPSPNFFDEFEMRRKALGAREVEEMMASAEVSGYTEVQYTDGGKGEVLLVGSVENADTGSASSNDVGSSDRPAVDTVQD